MRRLAERIDALNERVGRAVAWLTLAMVVTVFAVAVLRYAFDTGYIALQEAYVWMNGVLFMAAAGYTLKQGAQVRVDVFYRGMSPRARALVDALGTLFLLLPMVLAVFWLALPYVWQSLALLERSREYGGLPALYLLKSMILVFCLLTGLQGLSLLLRALVTLRGKA